MRRGQQDPRLRRRDQQRWGSCCTRQFGAATRKAIAWYGEHGGCCLFSHIVGVQQTTHLGQVLVLAFHLLSPPPELLDADSQSATLLDHLFLAIQPELVSGLEGRVRTGSRGGAEVVLVESDGERAVGGENEAGVAFAPVPGDVVSSGECQRKIYALDAGNVDWSGCCGFVDHVELGGGRGSGSKCEKRRQQLYGTRKTKHIPSQNPPNSQLYFPSPTPISTGSPILLFVFGRMSDCYGYFESRSSFTSLPNEITMYSYQHSAAHNQQPDLFWG